ncbi:three-Cys-motif partner protein TcmP [Geobacter benzoatilyticus]|uniref:Three-Cys-motif partner protein TcmP n=1 Tax=Geobacter benzoatilyticus TaxID=2815309 RepID=A0ABX7Q3Q9_9BACT|nr:three-Cys-motif partner protein TcmP [Geobacter benzoatilyticus]QSV45741.1 three-Cys-motif partner protein TcmP [Geobacter benzoatilyticus]
MQFHLPEIGAWGEEKYRLVHYYAQMFASSMKDKWQCRVYIDLFSGAGRARIKESGKVVDGSPLIALGIDDPFDRYIFCEEDATNIDALRKRVMTDYPSLDTHFVHGDANKAVDEILAKIPQHSPTYKVLGFCFVDPFKIDNLKFTTLKRLSAKYMDFLVLIPTGMDARRNVSYYMKYNSRHIEEFTGRPNWRDEWPEAEARGENFGLFFIKQFCTSMADIGYKYTTAEASVEIRSTEKNLPLYRLAFFSKHPLGHKFWGEAKKYSSPQLDLF